MKMRVRLDFHNHDSDPPRSGFALLLVLVCLLVVTVALVGLCRRGLLIALDEADALDQFRERWGEASLRQSALELAISIYGQELEVAAATPASLVKAQQNSPSLPPWKPTYDFPVELNGVRYRVVVSDESAKASLNAAGMLKNASAVQRLVTQLTGGRLRPLKIPVATAVAKSAGAFRSSQSWGELWPVGGIGPEAVGFEDLVDGTDSITLWGDGKLNLLRASDAVLFEMSRLILSDADSRRWVELLRRDWPGKTPEAIFTAGNFKTRDRVALLKQLGIRSSMVSVWISRAGGAPRYVHALATRTSGGEWQPRSTLYSP